MFVPFIDHAISLDFQFISVDSDLYDVFPPSLTRSRFPIPVHCTTQLLKLRCCLFLFLKVVIIWFYEFNSLRF